MATGLHSIDPDTEGPLATGGKLGYFRSPSRVWGIGSGGLRGLTGILLYFREIELTALARGPFFVGRQ